MAKEPREKCIMCDEGNPKPDCYWCSGTGYETRCQDEPICPHCGTPQSHDDLYQSSDLQCNECEKWMEVEVNYTPDYTTSKTDDPQTKHRKRMEMYARLKEPADNGGN